MATLNVNVPRFYCFLRKEFLYDGEAHHGELINACVFGAAKKDPMDRYARDWLNTNPGQSFETLLSPVLVTQIFTPSKATFAGPLPTLNVPVRTRAATCRPRARSSVNTAPDSP